jgi:outer membrane protein assembly factor BamB
MINRHNKPDNSISPRKRILIIITIGVLVAACIGTWAAWSFILTPTGFSGENADTTQMMYRMNPQHTGVYDSVSGGIVPQGRSAWNFSLPGMILITSPVVLNNTLFFSTGNNDIFALDATTGQEIWHRRIKDLDGWSLAVAGDTLFTTSFDRSAGDTSKYHGDLFALFASNGSTKWQSNLGNGESSELTVSNGAIFAGTRYLDDSVHTIDARTGVLIWKIRNYPQGVMEPPTVDNGTVYFGDEGTVYAVFAKNGSQKWTSNETGILSVGPVVVQDGRIYTISVIISPTGDRFAEGVRALDTSTGNVSWTFDGWNSSSESVTTPLVATHDTIFFGNSVNTTYAVDSSTGTVKWTYNAGKFIGASSYADGTLYFGAGEDLYALNARSGTLKWTFGLGNAVKNEPVIANGTVFAAGYSQSNQNWTTTLYAIR